jgi:hypothetical protein
MAYDDAPSDEIFNEIKQAAIEIWNTYDNTYGYVDEKMYMIENLKNFKDNWGTMVGMFDHPNQMKLLAKLSPEAKAKVQEWL